MNVSVIGVNFRTAGIDLLEKLFLKENEIGSFLEEILASNYLQEAVLLVTCNRVELYGVPTTSRDSTVLLNRCFKRLAKTPCQEIEDHIYTFHDRDAVSHLFRVTSSIDSMVVGEPQITGQVKRAFEIAKLSNSAGKMFNRLFPKTFSVAKKVRTHTDLSKGSVSIASVSVKQVKEIFPDLSDKSTLLIGAGEIAERVAFHFKNNQLGTLYLFNRSRKRAISLADKYGGLIVSDSREALAKADIVITSTSSPEYLLTRGNLLEVMENRKDHPLLIIDIGTPRNVDPEAGKIPNVQLINIDDLGKIVDDHKSQRERAIKGAERIIQEGVDSYFLGFRRSIPSMGPPVISDRQ